MAWTGELVGWLVERGTSKSPFICTLVAIAASLLVYFYKPYWSVRRVPGPPTTPLLGHLPLLAKYGPDVLIVLAKRYGSIFRFHLGRQPLVIIADPELCREVGIKKFKDLPHRSPISPFQNPIRSKVLFMTRGTRWSTMRNTVTSLYQPTHVSTQLPIMKSVIDTLISNLSNSQGDEVIFSDLALLMTTDVIGHSAFGFDFGLSKHCSLNGVVDPTKPEVEELASNYVYSVTKFKMDLTGTFSIILGLLFPLLQKPFSQILKRIPWTMDWKVHKSDQILQRRLNEIVTKRSNEPSNQRESKDFLSLILNARDSQKADKHLFTSDYISALAYEHLFAGSATTAFTLSSILYLVSGHPEVERKLLEEIDGFGREDMPTADDLLHKFPYLNQVIKEAMRFYTASPLIARETSGEVEIGGYVLPKGTWVWLATGVIAKDPEQFPEPTQFKPERFDPTCEEEKQRHPYASIPFGIGPRICIGMKFALQELRLALFHLYRRFTFRHSPRMEKPVALEYGIVLDFKHGVKLSVIKRT